MNAEAELLTEEVDDATARASQELTRAAAPRVGNAALGSLPTEALPSALGFVLDVDLNVSVEVGRAQLPVRRVMELRPGSVIELQRSASDPVEIYANNRCIGRGEIVIVGEQFGVRVTDLRAA